MTGSPMLLRLSTELSFQMTRRFCDRHFIFACHPKCCANNALVRRILNNRTTAPNQIVNRIFSPNYPKYEWVSVQFQHNTNGLKKNVIHLRLCRSDQIELNGVPVGF